MSQMQGWIEGALAHNDVLYPPETIFREVLPEGGRPGRAQLRALKEGGHPGACGVCRKWYRSLNAA